MAEIALIYLIGKTRHENAACSIVFSFSAVKQRQDVPRACIEEELRVRYFSASTVFFAPLSTSLPTSFAPLSTPLPASFAPFPISFPDSLPARSLTRAVLSATFFVPLAVSVAALSVA